VVQTFLFHRPGAIVAVVYCYNARKHLSLLRNIVTRRRLRNNSSISFSN